MDRATVSKIGCWIFGHRLLFTRRMFGEWELFRCVKCPALIAVHAGTGVTLDYTKDIHDVTQAWGAMRDENFDDFTG